MDYFTFHLCPMLRHIECCEVSFGFYVDFAGMQSLQTLKLLQCVFLFQESLEISHHSALETLVLVSGILDIQVYDNPMLRLSILSEDQLMRHLADYMHALLPDLSSAEWQQRIYLFAQTHDPEDMYELCIALLRIETTLATADAAAPHL